MNSLMSLINFKGAYKQKNQWSLEFSIDFLCVD